MAQIPGGGGAGQGLAWGQPRASLQREEDPETSAAQYLCFALLLGGGEEVWVG